MYTYVYGDMYTGLWVVFFITCTAAERKGFKDGRLEKQEPSSAPVEPGGPWAKAWGSSLRTLGKLSQSQTWAPDFSFGQASLESSPELR